QRYFYYVTALNIKGESRPPSIVSANPTAPPSPPTNINISSGDNFVLLSWEEPEDNGGLPIEEYRIYRGVNSVILSLLTTLPPDANSFNDTEVENGITYYYYVTASNLRGESTPSKTVSARPVGPPSPPQNISAVAGTSFVLLSWSPPASNGGEEIISYRIYRGEDENNFTLIAELLPTKLSYNDTGVKKDTTYLYYVTAVNLHYESEPSEIFTVRTLPPSPQSGEKSGGEGEGMRDSLTSLLYVAAAVSAGAVATYLLLRKRSREDPGGGGKIAQSLEGEK
ncbi:MAG: fibronectin type III domain-containing protein, partial [Thermoplasmata archaeon]|nr:fibronectin type III domain-containing protein [Thermoplasmata archaeon]